MNSCLYECTVMHARLAPRPHRFAYRIFLFALDLDELPTLSRRLAFFSHERPNLYTFRDRDYLPIHEPLHPAAAPASTPHSGSSDLKSQNPDLTSPAPRPTTLAPSPSPDLKARVVSHLAARGLDLTGGRVLLVTLPRILGHLFNPVSFFFCYDRHGAPVAALAEVTNTFHEVKPYFIPIAPRPDSPLRPPNSGGAAAAPAFRLRTPKHFYVSPFSDVDVAFDFQLHAPDDALRVHIDDYAGAARTLLSTLHGRRRPLTSARLAWWTFKYPLLSLRIVFLIHFHALLLWLKRVPWFAKAARPADQRDLYRPHASLA